MSKKIFKSMKSKVLKKEPKKYTAVLVRLVDKKTGKPVTGTVHVDAKAKDANHTPIIVATEIMI
uniref:Uncharacterized protein n=1 Tax=viral metagenome TaxID=1070528 RepID=A0A6M3JID6_9ZZZZ